ncbi:MAG: lysylphosphatidylglycerol synthase transmembrane domain-containing protein [Saprospiraceae bacterium]|nr:lysylphosphatidylglycerol synthase transmembrane domain-containing protein [Saprospiraceae bacterium]
MMLKDWPINELFLRMKEFFSKYKTPIKVILLLVVLAFIGQFIKHTNFQQIGNYLSQLPYTFLGILWVSFLAYLSATYSWQLCLGEDDKKVSTSKLFMIRNVGEVLSVFNPTSVIAGEALKVHYLKGQSISKENSISSILMSRILIILSAILLLSLSALYLIVKLFGTGISLIFVLLAGLLMIGFGYLLARFLLHSKLYLARFFGSLQTKLGAKFISDELIHSVKEVNRTAHIFYNRNHQRFRWAFFLSIVHWIFGAAEFYLILKTLGLETSLPNAVAVEMGVILFKTAGAIVPGQLGVEEYGNKVMLGVIGIASNEIWLVVSILRRARQIFWVGVAVLFSWVLRKSKNVQINQ